MHPVKKSILLNNVPTLPDTCWNKRETKMLLSELELSLELQQYLCIYTNLIHFTT